MRLENDWQTSTLPGLSAHSAAGTTAGQYAGIARLRWPSYDVTGAGSLAVVLHCARKVALVLTPLEACVLADDHCGQVCRRRIAQGWHEIHTLDAPRSEAPRRN